MSRVIPFKLLAICALLSACVTINVYFPAAAAEKAADDFVKDVLKAAPATNQSDKQSSILKRTDTPPVLLALAGNVLDLLITPARAAGDLNVATPAVRQVKASMQARAPQLKPYLDSGAVGLTATGLVEIRDQNAIPLAERNQVKKLVSDDNADRNTLYREIAVANGHSEWEADIRKTFAQTWAQNAASGWYVQDASGAWRKK